jgi:hypothetical protein
MFLTSVFILGTKRWFLIVEQSLSLVFTMQNAQAYFTLPLPAEVSVEPVTRKKHHTDLSFKTFVRIFITMEISI